MTLEITDKNGSVILFRSDIDRFNIPWTDWQEVSLPLAMMLEISLFARVASSANHLGISFAEGYEATLWF